MVQEDLSTTVEESMSTETLLVFVTMQNSQIQTQFLQRQDADAKVHEGLY